MYTEEEIKSIVENQREFFLSGKTLDLDFRIEQLKTLKKAVIDHQSDLEQALYDDLGRASLEAYFCDVGALIVEINEILHNLRKWAKPETHFSGIICFPSIITKVYKMPYGVSLIISPFNFPILLSLGVLAINIAGGNTAVIKSSSKSEHCTTVMKKILEELYPPEYVTLIDGGHDVADLCLEQPFDKIFYTGSTRVGVHVLESAAKNLTSTCLELGSENGNWCIVRKDANLKDAARKVAFFKALNSGQICLNINQVAVAKEVSEQFVEELKKAFDKLLGTDPLNNPEYSHLINDGAYDKCFSLSEKYRDKIVYGGAGNRETLKFEPTILYPVDIGEDIVQRELFCPLLPVVTYKDSEVDSLINTIERRHHGLSLYIFTKNVRWAKKVMQRMQFGGGCINEVCLYMMVKGVPFNGVGHSGMGAYHGEWGFKEFTHPSTVLIGSSRFNLSLREHPYDVKEKKEVIKAIER